MGNTNTVETPRPPSHVFKCVVCKKIACFIDPELSKTFCSTQCYRESLVLLNE